MKFLLVALILLTVFLVKRPAEPSPALPLPPAQAETVQEKEVRSLDGSLKLLMEIDQKAALSSYSFFIIEPTGQRRLLLTKTLEGSGSMDLPSNSWAPDDQYVFIKETDSGGLHYLVFKASGEEFAQGEQYLDVTPLLAKARPEFKLKEITGWAGPDLLYVTTVNEEGKSGPSFWFVVSSRSFLQLY